MTVWLSKEEKEQLVEMAQDQFKVGVMSADDVLKVKMELDAVEVATRAAIASERNARYMLWSTIFAAVSAVAAAGTAIITLVMQH